LGKVILPRNFLVAACLAVLVAVSGCAPATDASDGYRTASERSAPTYTDGSTPSPPMEPPPEGPGPAEPSHAPPGTRPAYVSRVVDGDTIEAMLAGRATKIRLIGIDTPETVHPSEPVGCYGPEASAFTHRMLEDREVRLEFDVERFDRYGRTLAYVWLGGRLFNETLVARGFAQVSTYPPNVQYVERFLRAQRVAREEGRGLWGDVCDQPSQPPPPGGPGAGCDPSYPDVCIPPPPPDLDCGDISFRRFRVTGSDPHRFDGDHDGIGCES
jgi:micrococcal nuclease